MKSFAIVAILAVANSKPTKHKTRGLYQTSPFETEDSSVKTIVYDDKTFTSRLTQVESA